MPTIVISNPDYQLACEQTNFTLRSNGKRIGRFPALMIERLVVHHGVEVSRKALDMLGAMGIPVTFLDLEGRVRSRLIPPWKQDAAARLGQARALFDDGTRMLLARRWVDAKIANAAAMVRRHAGNHPDPLLNEVIRDLRSLRASVARASAIDQLMGFEGAAGRIYFGVFGRMLRAPWAEFHGRNRRPPRDPVNAVLSYAYGILSHEVQSYAEANGLDPCIGYLHAPEAGRASLALDFMEPFRPVLGDRLTLRLINLGSLRPEHFLPDAQKAGIRITHEGRMELVKVFHDWSMECDEELAPGSSLQSPGGLIAREMERFTLAAHQHQLREFVPYYHAPEDASLTPQP